MQMVSNSCASLYFSLILLIYFECVTYRLYATVTIFKKRKATPRKNFGHATPLWQTLCNSHISLSQRSRWPLWRSLTVRWCSVILLTRKAILKKTAILRPKWSEMQLKAYEPIRSPAKYDAWVNAFRWFLLQINSHWKMKKKKTGPVLIREIGQD